MLCLWQLGESCNLPYFGKPFGKAASYAKSVSPSGKILVDKINFTSFGPYSGGFVIIKINSQNYGVSLNNTGFQYGLSKP